MIKKKSEIVYPKQVTLSAPDYLLSRRETNGAVLHVHSFFEVELYTEGEGTIYINNIAFPLQNGMICISKPNDTHKIDCPENSKAKLINLAVSPHFIDESLAQRLTSSLTPHVVQLGETEREKARTLLDYIEQEQASGKNKEFAKFCINALLALVVGYSKSSADSAQKQNPVGLALAYINEHFRENITLSSLARWVGINGAYLSSLFSKTTGMTFKEYLISMRISYAKALIGSNNGNLTFVCYESGFNSYSAFTRAFIASEGIPPLSYAKGLTEKKA